MKAAHGQVLGLAPLLVLAAVVATSASLALCRAAVARAHAQRVADAAALDAALARPDERRAVAEAAALRLGFALVEFDDAPDGVAVVVATRRRIRALGGVIDVGGRAAARALPVAGGHPPPERYRRAIARAAAREHLPFAILVEQLRAESDFDPRAVSAVGAAGIAQFMPATWAGPWNPWRHRSPFEPEIAIAAQARYLAILLDETDGDLRVALAAYNAGLARAQRPEPTWPAETRAYVRRILEGASVRAQAVLVA